jgi:D-alanyl-D-alanine dipeptidase
VIPYADPAALIDDPRVLRIAITDSGEPLVDAGTIAALDVDQSRAEIQQLSDDPFRVRAGLAGRLARAQACLPGGYQLQVKEGWRPVWVQQRLWDLCLDRLRASRPRTVPAARSMSSCSATGAPPGSSTTPGPHNTHWQAAVPSGRSADSREGT